MRPTTLLCATILTTTLALAQTSKPVSAFDQQLIDQQQQLLQAAQSKDATAVDRAIADDFQGIATNGDFYDKSDIVESAQTGMPKETRAYDFHVVKLNDDSAVVAYNLIVPGVHPRYRHMADTWARIGGQWKLKFRQITPNLWSAKDLDWRGSVLMIPLTCAFRVSTIGSRGIDHFGFRIKFTFRRRSL